MASPNADTSTAKDAIARIFRAESARVFATLVRLLGDFDLAEEALSEAFASAVEQWPSEGVPANPRAWLVSAGRFKGIDAMRRRGRLDETLAALAEHRPRDTGAPVDEEDIEDDRLRLIFTCCHPALSAEARLALTLHEVCGLTTDEIARAFLITPTTVAQRIVRAKTKIKGARISYDLPSRTDLPERLDAVLQVIYLLFNEGYSASSGKSLTRDDLSAEAIRLGRLLAELIPEAEVFGILALMLLQESRRPARTLPSGELVLLEHQERLCWNRDQIAEGLKLVQRALASKRIGPYGIQAAIAAVHAEASSASTTDWAQIVALYTLLWRIEPSPVVELNRAVALAMRDGPAAGLEVIDDLFTRGELAEYHLAHSARAEFCRRLGRTADAKVSYERAIGLARQEPERQFLEKRLSELDYPSPK